jgi:hypothetical protein
MQLAKERVPTLGVAIVTGAITIWAGYVFSVGRVDAWQINLPAPELFNNILNASRHVTQGHPAFLLGQHSMTGWWYFFPVAIAVKTPIPFLVLLVFGCWVCFRKPRTAKALIPLAFSLAVLLVGMAGNVNIGLRHVLPVYVGFSIVAGAGLVRLIELPESRAWEKWAGLGMLLWLVLSGAIHHPDYISYFNEFASAEPENILVDSDLDWGQDSWRLAERLKEIGVQEFSFTSGNVADFSPSSPLPKHRAVNPYRPYPGWTAVSPSAWKSIQFGVMFRDPSLVPWMEGLKPTERVGSLLLYYIPPSQQKHYGREGCAENSRNRRALG